MQVYNTVNLDHSDLVHDVAYDYYGQSLASCSSDHRIKVWVKNTSMASANSNQPDEAWICTDDWTAHQGPVWKLQWAHPQYGRILASCSFDRTVAIWEELNHESSTSDSTATSRKSNWKLRTRRDSQEPVHDIAFAPRSLGLQLATVSGDGYVRIYKPDDASNLEYWHETSFDAVVTTPSNGGNSSSSSSSTISSGLAMNNKRARELTSVAWCQAHFCPPMLAVAAKDGSIRIWAFNERFERWQVVHNLVGHTAAVHSIAWAPDTGRSYHLLASASSDSSVRIWGIAKSGDQSDAPEGTTEKKNAESGSGGNGGNGGNGDNGGNGGNGGSGASSSSNSHRSSAIVQQAKFVRENAHGEGKEVWRVQWDISGMQLASSGDDGQVRLWRKKLQGLHFENFETINSQFEPTRNIEEN